MHNHIGAQVITNLPAELIGIFYRIVQSVGYQ
jgi:hypothetical protein